MAAVQRSDPYLRDAIQTVLADKGRLAGVGPKEIAALLKEEANPRAPTETLMRILEVLTKGTKAASLQVDSVGFKHHQDGSVEVTIPKNFDLAHWMDQATIKFALLTRDQSIFSAEQRQLFKDLFQKIPPPASDHTYKLAVDPPQKRIWGGVKPDSRPIAPIAALLVAEACLAIQTLGRGSLLSSGKSSYLVAATIDPAKTDLANVFLADDGIRLEAAKSQAQLQAIQGLPKASARIV